MHLLFCSLESFQVHQRQHILGAAIIDTYDCAMARIEPCGHKLLNLLLNLLTITSLLPSDLQWFFFPSSEPTMGCACAHSHTNAQGAEGCKNLKVGGESALNLLSRDHFFLLQPFKYPTLTWWQLHACITARQVLTSVHSGTTPARRKRNSRATFQFSCVHK